MWRVKERGGGGEEKKRSSPPRLFHFWLSFHFSPGEHRKSSSSSFLVLFLFRNHTETLATQATAPVGDSSLTWTIQGTMQAKVLLALRSQLRERLIRLDKTNQKNLETIETSLFALVLDERSPVTETEVTVTVLCSVLTRPRYCGIAALFRKMPY